MAYINICFCSYTVFCCLSHVCVYLDILYMCVERANKAADSLYSISIHRISSSHMSLVTSPSYNSVLEPLTDKPVSEPQTDKNTSWYLVNLTSGETNQAILLFLNKTADEQLKYRSNLNFTEHIRGFCFPNLSRHHSSKIVC